MTLSWKHLLFALALAYCAFGWVLAYRLFIS